LMARCDQACGDRKKRNGNCPDPGDDGLAVQCVGPWACEKHEPLGRYITATRGPRKDYLPPVGTGGSAYIDLFAGPGRARVWSTGAVVDGSPLIALTHQEAPFSKLILCEKDPENAAALRERTRHDSRVVVIEGDCHERIDEIIAATPARGLNFALIDPFSLDQLRFDTIAKLARIQRMDLLIHLPTMDMKRNFGRGTEERLTKALGTDEWKQHATGPAGIARWAVDALRKKLTEFGYTGKEVPSPRVTNTKNGGLYHLVFASKHDLGDKIWKSIAKTSGSGQTSFF
jgi:three-Cys-motif partner protein